MSNILFDENGHLTKKALKAFKESSLSDDDLIVISEHICNCEKCADALANCFNDNELADVPLGFEEEVLSKIKNKKQKNNEFILYSIRVSMAACMALMIVFSSTFNFIASTKAINIEPPNLSAVNSINKSLNHFSQKIVSMEVFNNENKEK